jgi:hypothetical protein
MARTAWSLRRRLRFYPPEETDFGTRRYRALDPEGYEWSFRSYRPATTELR